MHSQIPFESASLERRSRFDYGIGNRPDRVSYKHRFIVIIQHLLELLMIQPDKLAYLTDLSGSRGRTSGETALSAHSEEHEVF